MSDLIAKQDRLRREIIQKQIAVDECRDAIRINNKKIQIIKDYLRTVKIEYTHFSDKYKMHKVELNRIADMRQKVKPAEKVFSSAVDAYVGSNYSVASGEFRNLMDQMNNSIQSFYRQNEAIEKKMISMNNSVIIHKAELKAVDIEIKKGVN